MDVGTIYIHLLLLNSLAFHQGQLYQYCAQSQDPVACLDDLPSILHIQESNGYGVVESRTVPPRQFYHYKDPKPNPTPQSTRCPSTSSSYGY